MFKEIKFLGPLAIPYFKIKGGIEGGIALLVELSPS